MNKSRVTIGLIFVFAVLANRLHAQVLHKSLAVGYDDGAVGRSISFTYREPLNKTWLIYGGLKYQINSKNYLNDYAIRTNLYKQFFAKNAAERFGLKLGTEKYLHSSNAYSNIFVFYDFQLTKATIRSYYNFWTPDFRFLDRNNSDLKYYLNFENTIGLGTRVKLSHNLNFLVQAGISFNFYKMTGASFYIPPSSLNYTPLVYGRMFTFGLDYAFRVRNPHSHKLHAEVKAHTSSLSVQFNDVQTGRNIGIGYHATLAKHYVAYGGLKFHINSPLFTDYRRTESYYFKQFRAQNLVERLGLFAGIEKRFKNPIRNLVPFAFYEVQAMRCTVSSLSSLSTFGTGGKWHDSAPFWSRPLNDIHASFGARFKNYGPIIALENYAGLGAEMKLSSKVTFKLKAGIGYNFYIGPDTYQDYWTMEFDDVSLFTLVSKKDEPWTASKHQLSRIFSVGLGYTL